MSPGTPPTSGQSCRRPGPWRPRSLSTHASLPFALSLPAALGLAKLNWVTSTRPKKRKKTSHERAPWQQLHLPPPAPLPAQGSLMEAPGSSNTHTLGRPGGCGDTGLASPLRCRRDCAGWGSPGPSIPGHPRNPGFSLCTLSQGPPQLCMSHTDCLWHDPALVAPRGLSHLHYPGEPKVLSIRQRSAWSRPQQMLEATFLSQQKVSGVWSVLSHTGQHQAEGW